MVTVRDARPGDGAALAAIWREGAEYYHASEVSVPFWEERAGYTRRGITFSKRLA